MTLARNRTRTLMTAFGIFWGTVILALCIGGGHGFRGMMTRNFAGFATNMGAVIPSSTTIAHLGYNKGRTWQLTRRDIADLRRSVEEIDLMATIRTRSSVAWHRTGSVGTRIMGVDPDYWRVMTPVIYGGRLINESDNACLRKVAVVGKNIAGQLFGDADPVGEYILVDDVYYKVVGVAGQKTQAAIAGRIDDNVWIPGETFGRTYSSDYNFGFLIFTTRKGFTPTDLKPRIGRILRHNHMISPDDEGAIDFSDLSEMFEMVDKLFGGIDLLMLFVGLGTLLAGVIGVGNIMWIIVRERSGEIGIRRAIGARPSDIIIQILSESTLLTTVAGLAGITLAVIVLGAVDYGTYDEWHGTAGFELSFRSAAVILAAFILLGSAAGLLPAFKAMRIRPVEAINAK